MGGRAQLSQSDSCAACAITGHASAATHQSELPLAVLTRLALHPRLLALALLLGLLNVLTARKARSAQSSPLVRLVTPADRPSAAAGEPVTSAAAHHRFMGAGIPS